MATATTPGRTNSNAACRAAQQHKGQPTKIVVTGSQRIGTGISFTT
ncbi:hypothetical protein [Pantoea sp. 18059]|nr:hypothetical protein [Pantoea sp. 18059]